MVARTIALYSRPKGFIGPAVLRVGLAAVMLVHYLWHFGERDLIWGPRGQLGFHEYATTTPGGIFALYSLSGSPLYSTSLVIASVVIAAAFGLGVLPRVTCWLFAITTYASVARDPLATDAGQSLAYLLAFLLCIVDTSRYLAPLARRRQAELGSLARAIVGMLHNSGRFLIAWQICMVYFWAAFWKLGGDEWRDGTALGSILGLERFQPFPWISHALATNAILTAVLTYFTVAFQMGFPFLMWNQRIKPYLITVAVTLHLGIAFLLGLISFSAIMIAGDLSLLSDQQFELLFESIRGALIRARTAVLAMRA